MLVNELSVDEISGRAAIYKKDSRVTRDGAIQLDEWPRRGSELIDLGRRRRQLSWARIMVGIKGQDAVLSLCKPVECGEAIRKRDGRLLRRA